MSINDIILDQRKPWLHARVETLVVDDWMTIAGNLMGNLTIDGNLIVSGNVIGNLLGNLVGDVTGNLYGNIMGGGIITSNVADGKYFLSEIDVSGGDITSIISHIDSNNNIFMGGNVNIAANVTNSVIIGERAGVDGNNVAGGVAIGYRAESSTPNSISIGTNATCDITGNGADCISIGQDSETQGNYAISMGLQSFAKGEGCIALGAYAYAEEGVDAADTVIGYNSQVYGGFNVAVGSNHSLGNNISEVNNTTAIGFEIESNQSNALILGGPSQFTNVYINDLSQNDNGGNLVVGSVLWNPTSAELSHSVYNSGSLFASGEITISGTGSQQISVGFLPRQISVMYKIANSTGSTKGAYGEYTYMSNGTEVQYGTSFYGFATARWFDDSHAIAYSSNGSSASLAAAISIDPLSSLTEFTVNCTTYGTGPYVFKYVARG